MIKETKTEKTITETIRTRHCDYCDEKITTQYSSTRCECCEKDVCKKCVGYEEVTSGDYNNIYCKHCWKIGEDYRIKINYFEKEIDRLRDEWILKCKE